MDLLKEYQDMLKAAPEIQFLWSPDIGDYHTWNDNITVIGPTQFESATGCELRDRNKWGDKEEFGQYIIGYYKKWVIMNFKNTNPYNAESIIKNFQEVYTLYKNALWLPRQDQLQDILAKRMLPIDFIWWIHTFMQENIEYFKLFTTMEQLWLAFVMLEKYNKVWNGSSWV